MNVRTSGCQLVSRAALPADSRQLGLGRVGLLQFLGLSIFLEIQIFNLQCNRKLLPFGCVLCYNSNK